MADDKVVAKALGLVAAHAHFAVESGVDGVARAQVEVDALVHATELGPIAVVRGDLAGNGHMVAADVDDGAVGHLALAEWVYAPGVHAIGEDFDAWLCDVGDVGQHVALEQADAIGGVGAAGHEGLVIGAVGRRLLGLNGERAAQCQHCQRI